VSAQPALQGPFAGKIALRKYAPQLHEQAAGAPTRMLIAQLKRSPMHDRLVALTLLTARIVARPQGLCTTEMQALHQVSNRSFAQLQGHGDLARVLTALTAMKDRPTNRWRNGKRHDRPPCAQRTTS
jgi:hypothetical protein